MACWASIRFRIFMGIVLERHFALLLWTLNIFCNLIYCSYSEFKQLDACWASETIVTDNQVVFRTVRNIFSYGLGKFVGLNVFNSPKIRLRKDKFPRLRFKKISRTLSYELYNAFLKKSETFRTPYTFVKIIPFNYSGRKERVLKAKSQFV